MPDGRMLSDLYTISTDPCILQTTHRQIHYRRVTLGAKGAKMCTQAPAPGYTFMYPGAGAWVHIMCPGAGAWVHILAPFALSVTRLKKSDLTKHFNSRHLQCPHCNMNLKTGSLWIGISDRVSKGKFYLSNQALISVGEHLIWCVLTVPSIIVLYSLIITHHITDKLKIIKFLPNGSDVIRNINRNNIPAIFSWEPALWTLMSQERVVLRVSKKKPLQFSAINSDFWA